MRRVNIACRYAFATLKCHTHVNRSSNSRTDVRTRQVVDAFRGLHVTSTRRANDQTKNNDNSAPQATASNSTSSESKETSATSEDTKAEDVSEGDDADGEVDDTEGAVVGDELDGEELKDAEADLEDAAAYEAAYPDSKLVHDDEIDSMTSAELDEAAEEIRKTAGQHPLDYLTIDPSLHSLLYKDIEKNFVDDVPLSHQQQIILLEEFIRRMEENPRTAFGKTPNPLLTWTHPTNEERIPKDQPLLETQYIPYRIDPNMILTPLQRQRERKHTISEWVYSRQIFRHKMSYTRKKYITEYNIIKHRRDELILAQWNASKTASALRTIEKKRAGREKTGNAQQVAARKKVDFKQRMGKRKMANHNRVRVLYEHRARRTDELRQLLQQRTTDWISDGTDHIGRTRGVAITDKLFSDSPTAAKLIGFIPPPAPPTPSAIRAEIDRHNLYWDDLDAQTESAAARARQQYDEQPTQSR